MTWGPTSGRRRPWVVLAAVLGLVVIPGAPAQAYVEVAYATRGQVMTERPEGHPGEVRATLVLENLRAGESRLLRAESVAERGTPDRNAIGQKITCERPDGTSVRESWGGTNLLAVKGRTPVRQRLLFTAPTAGTYLCRLRVYVDSHSATQPGRAVLYSGFIGDVYGTLGTAPVGSPGRFLGAEFFPATDTATRTVMAVTRYPLPAGTVRVQGRADLFLTNCYGPGGAGCPRGSFPPSGSSTYAVQGVLVPSSRQCPRVTTARAVATFDSATHHIGSIVDAVANIPPGARCSYTYYVQVQRISGLPFVVQLYPYSQASLLATVG